ncbi:ethylene receptor 3-like [Ananas comosus]|uniref:Ethylene receptor n=1 Tax=Ananas comosus TaxID=4615 RepID=A0A0F6NUB7_ANACO|nr:ethylene receptor 3-like [Ananas comosus]AIT52524.1 ethylene response 2 [Ananas comosus]ALJ33166.1 ETR2 [Ananas comosus]
MRNPIPCELLILLSLLFSSSSGAEFPQCNCDGDGGSGWPAVEAILRWQKASDFLIAAAYFSIPLELLYFVTCSSLFPFKWILLQFTSFIVLCGLTHLLSVFTYEPHSFVLALGVTVSKFFTALVSFLTAVTFLTLIPQLLRVKVRESFLRLKARELGREVGLMKRQEEAGWHVRMLTRQIRKSLDRHTILYTTLVELSRTLALRNCAVWMPDHAAAAMTLTHQLPPPGTRNSAVLSIPMDDPEVARVRSTDGAKVLNSKSSLGCSSGGDEFEFGAVAAIRMPMLKVSDFEGGAPEVIEACYAILVLALPRDGARAWSPSELELVAVVADQVAVALSHASVLEESQSMRDKLEQRNRVLLRAKRNLSMANEARNAFQRAMSRGMRMPIHSILSLLSVMQEEENLGPEQRLAIEATARAGSVVSTLINDAMEISVANREQFALEMSPFRLKSLVKEAASVARCLCDSRGFGFGVRVENSISERVVGDERRIFHVILHMLGSLLHSREEGFLTFRVYTDREAEELQGRRWAQLRTNLSGGYAIVKFEIGVRRPQNSDSVPPIPLAKPPNSEGFDMGLSFSMCKKLVQLMQGDICAVLNSHGQPESMTLVLRFQLRTAASVDRHRSSASSSSLVKGLRVLLTDEDGVNRTVTRKLLEKLGCFVCTAASAAECLSVLGASIAPFQLVILDLDLNQISGLELGLAIRKLRSGSWPLIVGLTAGAKEDAWEKCIQSGMSGLIRKPVLLRAVKEELIRVLQNT